MAIIKLCADELTRISASFSTTVHCTPRHTPVGPGSQYLALVYSPLVDTQANPPTLSFLYTVIVTYLYINNGVILEDICVISDQPGSVVLSPGLKTCCNQNPSISNTATCSNISTTPTEVMATLNIDFVIGNLCSPAIICIDQYVHC